MGEFTPQASRTFTDDGGTVHQRPRVTSLTYVIPDHSLLLTGSESPRVRLFSMRSLSHLGKRQSALWVRSAPYRVETPTVNGALLDFFFSVYRPCSMYQQPIRANLRVETTVIGERAEHWTFIGQQTDFITFFFFKYLKSDDLCNSVT